jgi:hypothetical protein
MIDWSVAQRAGVTPADLNSVFSGKASASVANKLNVPMAYIEEYIDRGSASANFAQCLGVSVVAATELGVRLSKEGRIGLVIGLLIAK